jgi:hypothetical protein
MHHRCTRLADNISGTRLRAHTSQVGLDHSPRNHRQKKAYRPRHYKWYKVYRHVHHRCG